jgi:hypothetical protein
MVKSWRDTCSLKIFCAFFMVFLGILNISCSSGRKEIHSEQTNTASSLVLPTTQVKTTIKDSIPSTASLYFTSIVNDTITGVLYVTGNEPFTTLTLSVSSGVQYHVEADSSLKSHLWQLQGKRVSVIGMKKSMPTEITIHVSSFHTAP